MAKHVMAVDDDPNVLTLVDIFLKHSGFTVVTVSDPLSVPELLQTTSPDLFIIDLTMPGMTGLELCRWIRSQQAVADRPIIVLASRSNADSLGEEDRAIASASLFKPVIYHQLINQVRRLLDNL